MPNENTAIHDLLAGLQRKPLDEDPADDVLFAGSRPGGGPAGPRRMARGTNSPPNLFEMPAPQAPLPSPHLAVALPTYDRQISTARVQRGNKKLFLIPLGLGVAAAVVVGFMMSGGNDKQVAASVGAKTPGEITLAAAHAVPPAPPPPPTVTPIAQPMPAPAAAAGSDPGALPKDAVSPAEVVPASTFEAKAEATVPTVSDSKSDRAVAKATESEAAESRPASHGKTKSHHDATASATTDKRVTKHGKHDKKVAVSDKLEKPEHTDDPKLGGNGALSVSSGEPREVWVDGRNSKRMTPLRVLLTPGKHKVTLFDKERGTAKTFDVEIKPNTTTKIAK